MLDRPSLPAMGRYGLFWRAPLRGGFGVSLRLHWVGAVQAPERKNRFFTLSFYSDLLHTIFAKKSMT